MMAFSKLSLFFGFILCGLSTSFSSSASDLFDMSGYPASQQRLYSILSQANAKSNNTGLVPLPDFHHVVHEQLAENKVPETILTQHAHKSNPQRQLQFNEVVFPRPLAPSKSSDIFGSKLAYKETSINISVKPLQNKKSSSPTKQIASDKIRELAKREKNLLHRVAQKQERIEILTKRLQEKKKKARTTQHVLAVTKQDVEIFSKVTQNAVRSQNEKKLAWDKANSALEKSKMDLKKAKENKIKAEADHAACKSGKKEIDKLVELTTFEMQQYVSILSDVELARLTAQALVEYQPMMDVEGTYTCNCCPAIIQNSIEAACALQKLLSGDDIYIMYNDPSSEGKNPTTGANSNYAWSRE
jgi:hypothetical protein